MIWRMNVSVRKSRDRSFVGHGVVVNDGRHGAAKAAV